MDKLTTVALGENTPAREAISAIKGLLSAEAQNQAEALIHTTEKTLEEAGDKVAAADRTEVEAAIAELKTAAEGEDVADIGAKSEALAQVSMKIGEALYKQAAEAEAAAATATGAEAAESPGDDGDTGGAAEDEVVDADFEEVDDDKKDSAA